MADPVATLAYRPWTAAIEPFQVSPRTWYVAGQTWVGCWLIETSGGCILIDTAIPESAYLLIDSIYKTGHKPTDIKKILLSHAHFDHCGAAQLMKEITGAEMYMSKEDWDFYQKVPEETNPADGKTYTLGMHGGVGANTMNDKYYASSKMLTPALRDRFFEDEAKLTAMHIDIALPSHPNQIEITDRAGQYTNENNCYYDPTVWADFVRERVRQVRVLMQ